MPLLVRSLATGFAALACACAANAGESLLEPVPRERPLAYRDAARASPKTSSVTWGENLRPARGDELHASLEHARPLREANELRYHYAAGSSLSLTARPRHFSFGWRSQF
jgi:hypothetical protein